MSEDSLDIIDPCEFAVLTCEEKHVTIASPFYAPDIKCTFPRALRIPHKFYETPAKNVRIVANAQRPYYVVARGAEFRETTQAAVDALEDDFDSGCIQCIKETICRILVPCGHFCACAKCAEELAECPICDAPVIARIPWKLAS